MGAKNQKTKNCSGGADLELVRRYQNKDQEAVETLLKSHFRFIRILVRRFSEPFFWVDREDLVELGTIGFWKAAKTFKVLVFRYFHPWARRWIRSEIHNSPEVTADKLIPRGNKRIVNKAVEELMRKLDRAPTLEEISERTELSVEQVEKALNAITISILSLEGEEGPMEIEDPHQIETLNEIELQDSYQLVRESINRLTPGQKDVIIGYYFSEPTTDGVIAAELGMKESAITRKRGRAETTLGKIIEGDRRWTPKILNSF